MRKILLILIFFWGLYSFRITQVFNWDTDWGRDLAAIARISLGRPTLLGPNLSGAVFAGPYYYYFGVPILVVSEWNEQLLIFFNAFVFAVGITLLFKISGFWPTIIVGLSPIWLVSARHFWNGYFYLPGLLILIICIFKKRKWNFINEISWGLLAGIVLNIHPAAILAIGPLWIVLYLTIRKWRSLVPLLLTFTPLIVFEFRHNWIMTNSIVTGNFITLVNHSKNWHYLLPLVLVVLVWLAIKQFKMLTAFIIFAWIVWLPMFYFDSNLPGGNFYKTGVHKVLADNWLSENSKFNILEISDTTHKVVAGDAYRYYFLKEGFIPLPISDYKNADKLVIFSRISDVDISKLGLWEMQEFGTDKNSNIRLYLQQD